MEYKQGFDRVGDSTSFPFPIKLEYDSSNIYLTPLWIPETSSVLVVKDKITKQPINLLDANELGKLQRQLAILQRSGGSGAQIASLRQQINDKTQQIYFDTQQQQIDELQEAVDTQLERLEEQIDLMKEQLEYEKDHGLLWREANEILKGTAPEITNFIMENTKKYWGEGAAEYSKNQREIIFEADQYKSFVEYVEGGLGQLVAQFCAPTNTEELEPLEEITSSEETPSVVEEPKIAEQPVRSGPSDEDRERMAREAAAAENAKHTSRPNQTQMNGTFKVNTNEYAIFASDSENILVILGVSWLQVIKLI